MTALLTIGRRSVWEAIDQWPALNGVFRAKYRGDAPPDNGTPIEAFTLRDAPTSQNELPAIAIAPATSEFDWILNQMGQNTYALAITIWTDGWTWPESERLWEETARAIFQSRPSPDSRVTYVSRPVSEGGTGHYPTLLGSRFTRMRIGTADNEEQRPKVLAHTFGVSLKLNLQAITGI